MASKRMTIKRRGVKKGKSRRVKNGLRRSRRYRGGVGNTIPDLQEQQQKLQKDLIALNHHNKDLISNLHNEYHSSNKSIILENKTYEDEVKKIKKEIDDIQTKIKKRTENLKAELKMYKAQAVENESSNYSGNISDKITEIENELNHLETEIKTTKSPSKSKNKIKTPPRSSMVTIPLEMYRRLRDSLRSKRS